MNALRHPSPARAADLSRAAATAVLDTATEMAAMAGREVKKLPTLRGRTVVNLFYEDSTRTRISFEAAAKRLSADVINFSAKGSSVSKGESLKDTALTLQAMGADAVVIRHPASGAPHRLAHWVDGTVLNAGDGTHEHPTQALLDAYTMRCRHGRIDGLKVAIVGDVLHSRVARSNVLLLHTLGAQVTLVAPPTLLPVGVTAWPADVSYDLDAVLPHADVVMMLRVQRERMTRLVLPVRARVLPPLRPRRRPGAGPARARDRHAPRADEPRHGDRARGGRLGPLHDRRTGRQRRQRPDGRALPDARGQLGMSFLIKGVRVLGGEPTDLLLRDGVIAADRPGIGSGGQGRRGARRRRAGRPARPGRPAHPPARAGPGGRRDRRVRLPGGGAGRLHRGVRDGQHLAGGRHRRRGRAGLAARPGGRPGRRAADRRGHRRAGRRAAGRARRDGRLRGAGADLLRRRALRARPATDAPGAGVRQGVRRGDRPARRGAPADRGRPDARGRGLGRARAARLAGGRRGGDHRPRRAARRARRRPAARLPRLDRGQRGDPALGQAPAAGQSGSPPRSPRTTCCSPTIAPRATTRSSR